MKIKVDRFVLSIIIVIGLAYIFPQWGAPESKIPIDTIGAIGISLIFFFYGLKLSPSKLKEGVKNWKLHLLIQTSTFLIFPLLVLALQPFIQNKEQETIWLAFFFLAALPSTVSSSVVMVSIAKGNIPAAIFNASISGIIGIVLTPLWMGLFVKNAQADFNFIDIYTKLIIQIILPVVIGVLLQRYLGEFALKHSKKLTLFDKSVILLIIYKSFANSFNDNIFSSVSVLDLLLLFILVLILFSMLFYAIGFLAKKMKFTIEDQITAQFCGTKKSLVHGTVFSKIIFGNIATIGIILLPIMLFHATQILLISIVASKMSHRNHSS
ncbi:bile acid:sodium symporter [Lacinutrix sp. C3R15]|uniref:bile acid:sodium symporter family protein n=1 Tax=Flavobacteriaceae TaxID=49546 RepID=UPI001C0808EA|nr:MULTISPECIES: bile acid:sodium symporter family protein [Flavobacteriaceae]MBU2940786.1 bile acid:sodium symporter [Lacinutrix sp. C3R15]MDO6624104.1 bile acid:sodium symporter family protein [Oceanihabitans sp. 1_MG-2023]